MGIRDIAKGRQFRKTAINVETINKLVENGYLAEAREVGVKKKETFAPSSIGYDKGNGVCDRYWYMAFEGKYVFEESNDAMSMATMMNGTYSGERIGKVFKNSGTLVSLEEEMKMVDPPIRGYIDALLKIENEDGEEETVVAEVKTTRSEVFIQRVTTMKPAVYHLYQILLYMRAKNCKNGFLYYENRNDLSFVIIPVGMNERNEKILDDALEWLRSVRANWEAAGDTLPERPFTQKSVQCKSCPVRKACWEELGEGTSSVGKMIPAKI